MGHGGLGGLYTGWCKAAPPDDLPAEMARLREMLADRVRRRAVRETLTAVRDGVEERIARISLPTLVVFGSADDHFADPVAETKSTTAQLRGEHLIVEGAGHSPTSSNQRSSHGRSCRSCKTSTDVAGPYLTLPLTMRPRTCRASRPDG